MQKKIVNDIRTVSRHLIRELGFMNNAIAGTQLSPSAVHALIEIDAAKNLSAKELAEILLLEKSTISRLIKSLIIRDMIEETTRRFDARCKLLTLTIKGRETLKQINDYAQAQVSEALKSIDKSTSKLVLFGISEYATALERARRTENKQRQIKASIKNGYHPGVIGRITEMHANYYSALIRFGAEFEKTVAAGLSDFIERVDKPDTALWTVQLRDRTIGSIAIDGNHLGENIAHLRWFILESSAQGQGLGKKLIAKAIKFCKQKDYNEVHLWTFKGLDAARALYLSHGFELVEEQSGKQWGKAVLEQKYVRVLEK